jgi:hypothetical protein
MKNYTFKGTPSKYGNLIIRLNFNAVHYSSNNVLFKCILALNDSIIAFSGKIYFEK